MGTNKSSNLQRTDTHYYLGCAAGADSGTVFVQVLQPSSRSCSFPQQSKKGVDHSRSNLKGAGDDMSSPSFALVTREARTWQLAEFMMMAAVSEDEVTGYQQLKQQEAVTRHFKRGNGCNTTARCTSSGLVAAAHSTNAMLPASHEHSAASVSHPQHPPSTQPSPGRRCHHDLRFLQVSALSVRRSTDPGPGLVREHIFVMRSVCCCVVGMVDSAWPG
jgi:hypothetical protein